MSPETFHASVEIGGIFWALIKLYQIERKMDRKLYQIDKRVTELELIKTPTGWDLPIKHKA